MKKTVDQEKYKLRYAPVFQPFISALLKNKFISRPKSGEIRALIINNNLDEFLRIEALKLNPELRKQKGRLKKILAMINLADYFKNYDDLMALFNDLPRRPEIICQILNYEVSESGKLVLETRN